VPVLLENNKEARKMAFNGRAIPNPSLDKNSNT
jgi:hypothetical protein